MENENENLTTLNLRIPQTLKKLMKKYVALDAHQNISDLARDAIREKIKRDAPALYEQLFKETAPA